MAVSTIVGVLVGFPALRVKGLYLAIATFAFGEIVRNGLNIVYFTRRSAAPRSGRSARKASATSAISTTMAGPRSR